MRSIQQSPQPRFIENQNVAFEGNRLILRGMRMGQKTR